MRKQLQARTYGMDQWREMVLTGQRQQWSWQHGGLIVENGNDCGSNI